MEQGVASWGSPRRTRRYKGERHHVPPSSPPPDLAPLDVSGYGSLEEREAAGDEIDSDERALMQRALDENSVVVAQMTPFYD